MALLGSLAALVFLLAACSGEIGSTRATPSGDLPDQPGSDPTYPDGGTPNVSPGDPGSTPIRRLTATEYANTVADLLGVAPPSTDGVATGTASEFDNSSDDFSVSGPLVEQYLLLAETLAGGADPQALSKCDAATTGEPACARAFVQAFGRRAFRRPVTTAELDDYAALFTTTRANNDYVTSLRVLLTRMLISPEFLYKVELGEPSAEALPKVTTHELAARISYLATESMPDAALSDAADMGNLSTPAQVAAQIDRLVATPKGHTTFTHFYEQWLKVTALAGMTKDSKLYPTWSMAARSVVQGLDRFLDDVTFASGGDLSSLLTAPYTYADDNVGKLYGLASSGAAFTRADFNAAQRVGLLGQPALLAAFGKADKSSPILRGVFIMRNLLCAPLPPPPPGANNIPSDLQPTTTTRAFYANLTSPAGCQACHGTINPIGYGLEHFDAIGAWRDSENNVAIDSTGEIKTGDVMGTFDGEVELSKKLSASHDVQQCFAQQWFRFAFGRTEVPGDAPLTDALGKSFEESHAKLATMPRVVSQQDAFYRLHYSKASTP
jgi:hypothetical protein